MSHSKYKKAGLFNPAIDNSINLGDEIISRSVVRALMERCKYDEVVQVPTLRRPTADEIIRLNDCEQIFVGGTNLLSSNLNLYKQWKINWYDILRLKKVTLMGVGWWQYQRPANFYTRQFLSLLLDSRKVHSVRDSYTYKMLLQAGFKNVVMTSCPTLWNFSDTNFEVKRKSSSVVFTLTYYSINRISDMGLIKLLLKSYKKLYFWPQGNHDLEYFKSICSEDVFRKVSVLDSNLFSFDKLLEDKEDMDYIGTRLHGGIHAISKGARAIVLAVDNRAIEIASDTGLRVCDRSDFARLKSMIDEDFDNNITLPIHDIVEWCGQF